MEIVWLVYKKEASEYCPELISICASRERAEAIIGLPKKIDERGKEYYEHTATREGRLGTVETTTYFWIEERKVEH